MMTQILFIHGAGGYDDDSKLAGSLQSALGPHQYNVEYPRMPNEDAPESEAWKAEIAKELALLRGKVVLVGHSLGASMLLKYLSEEPVASPIAGVFLIAAPYWNADDPDIAEYALRDDFAAHLPKETPLFFYHSRGDEWVPFEHLARYAAKLPHATIREFEGRGHQFNDDLSEVAADIASLQA